MFFETVFSYRPVKPLLSVAPPQSLVSTFHRRINACLSAHWSVRKGSKPRGSWCTDWLLLSWGFLIVSLCRGCWIITGWWRKVMKSLSVFTSKALCPVYGQHKPGSSAHMSTAMVWMWVVREICIFALWGNCWAKMGRHSKQKSSWVLRKGIKCLHFQGWDKQSIEQWWNGKQELWPKFSKIWEVLGHGTEQEPLTTSTGARLVWFKLPT